MEVFHLKSGQKSAFSLESHAIMTISLTDLAKKLDIAPEAVMLHAMDIDFDIPEDEMIPDEIAAEITKIELGDEIAQTEHQIEEELEREIVEEQQKRTAGNKKKTTTKKKEKPTEPEEKKEEPKEEKPVEIQKSDDGSVILPEMITVRDLATKIEKPIPLVLIKLKQNGIIANLKEELDYETSHIIAQEFGVKVRKESAALTSQELFRGDLTQLLSEEEDEQLIKRPPVISVMGHVDHGKTSILDYIRKAQVAEGEAGGITQRIGAYQIVHEGYDMTFLDTPGHEAFTVMRARGARATDIAVLVVAATEGLKPQSIEAIHHAREADIPIIVAVNKMDMAGANPDMVKGQLAEQELNPEDWGGDVPCIEVSAKTGLGIDKLLETIQVVAEVQDLKANPNRSAICTVIESTMDPKIGIIATVLVNTGTLKRGDPYVIYDQHGKIRTMKNFMGTDLKEAAPSVPVQITGLSALPNVGDLLQVMKSDKEARRKAEEVASIVHEDELGKRKKLSLAAVKARLAEQKKDQMKVIVKSESQGTLEAVVSEIEKVHTDGVLTKVVHHAVGDISESDIMLAAAGDAVIVGFAIGVSGRIKKMAEKEGVIILLFDVIYHLTEKLEEMLEGYGEEEEGEEILGTLKIKGVFASNKKMAVVGGDVIQGKIRQAVAFRLLRGGEGEDEEPDTIGIGKLESIQLGQKQVGQAEEGTECGLRLQHKELKFEVGDRLEFFVSRKAKK